MLPSIFRWKFFQNWILGSSPILLYIVSCAWLYSSLVMCLFYLLGTKVVVLHNMHDCVFPPPDFCIIHWMYCTLGNAMYATIFLLNAFIIAFFLSKHIFFPTTPLDFCCSPINQMLKKLSKPWLLLTINLFVSFCCLCVLTAVAGLWLIQKLVVTSKNWARPNKLHWRRIPQLKRNTSDNENIVSDLFKTSLAGKHG